MAFDHKTKKIYLPAAEYEMVPATEAGKQRVMLVLTK